MQLFADLYFHVKRQGPKLSPFKENTFSKNMGSLTLCAVYNP